MSLALSLSSRFPAMLPCLFRVRLNPFTQGIHASGFKEGFLKSTGICGMDILGTSFTGIALNQANVHLLRSSLCLRKRNEKLNLSLSVQLDG